MVLRPTVIATLTLICALYPTAWGDEPQTNAARTLFVYPSNHGFLHQTGYHVPYGWAAMHRIHQPGYFIEGQASGGEMLEPGTYRYVFPFKLLSGQHPGLLSSANDVVRIEAWDVTTHECLMSRTFQVSDFLDKSHHYTVKALTFSTWGREGHRFEPRVYWPGLSGVALPKIILDRLPDFDFKELAAKADRFENAMGGLYLDRGFVVTRRTDGEVDDTGDAGIWTGLYAASQAWRYKATRSPEALERMHESLRALHQLYTNAPTPGTLVRYVYPDGRIHPHTASKDTYSGFFFAIAHCLPLVKDRPLRKALLKDVEGLAAHFIDHDLAFVPEKGTAVDLKPSITQRKLTEVFDTLRRDPRSRQRLIRLLEAIRFYFLIHAQRPWPELPQMIGHLKRNDIDSVDRNMLPFLNGALKALKQLQRNVHKSAILWRWKDAPYQKLDRLLMQMLKQLEVPARPQLRDIEELKFLSSQSVHSLHFLKVAGEVLPKPNRYQRFYNDNLWQNQALLKTAMQWNNMDDELIAAVTGDAHAAALRTNSNHLQYLALFNLIKKERNAGLRKIYQNLFEQQYQPLLADHNAMIQVMRPVLRLPAPQTGLAYWTLSLYSDDRQGRGEAYWRTNRAKRAAQFGGEVSGQARDPIPVNLRQRDSFIWQRSARSLRGDDAEKSYPPLDYLFVYWMGRANGQLN